MVAKGFRGRYFTLQAITATVAALKEHKRKNSFYAKKHHHLVSIKKDEDPPPLEELHISKPCYCNIFFACKAHKALKLSRIKKPPLCRCRKTKTGIAPPLTS